MARHPFLKKYLSIIILFMLAIVWVFSFSSNQRIVAATIPAFVRIGIDTGTSFIDLKPSQGSYRLVDKASGKVLDSSVSGKETYRVQMKSDKSGLQVFSASSSGGSWKDKGSFKGPVVIEQKDSTGSSAVNLVELDGKRYRGSMEVRIKSDKSGVVAINQLGLEEYLYGVLPREMSDGWPLEALKAQAVAARTYTLQNLGKYCDEGYNLCSGTNCQVYGGYNCEGANCTRAVNETRGMVLMDNMGSIVAALFHSNSGGYLEDNVNVFGADLYYLKGKPDPYSKGYGLYDWGLTTVAEGWDSVGRMGLRNILRANGSNTGIIESLKLVKDSSGRVKKVIITDNQGNTTEKTGSEFGGLYNPGFQKIGADQFMGRFFDLETDATYSVIGENGVVSTMNGGGRKLSVLGGGGTARTLGNSQGAFQVRGASGTAAIKFFPQTITVKGHGWGHGVGMSQWGAYGMAKQGFGFDQILGFYYSGTRLVTLK